MGLLFAPLGSLICALVAKSKGWSVRRFAVMGAAYSAAMLLPWVYLVLRMYGRTTSSFLIGMSYFGVFGIWPVSLLTITMIFMGEEDVSQLWALWLILSGLAMLASFVLLVVVAPSRSDNFSLRQSTSQYNVIPHPLYVLPFAGLQVSNICMFLLLASERG